MSKKAEPTQMNRRYWVGLDWGGEQHAVCVVDDARNVLSQFSCGTTLSDLEGLAARLKEFESIAGIAIEATSDPVVCFLLQQGFTIYPINPKLSKNWREGHSVAGVKNDARDGMILALELSRRHESLRPLEPAEPVVAELAGLCEVQRELIDERTALIQRLKATLKQYHPVALRFFRDWSSPAAWRFIKRFPNPAALTRAKDQTLIAFLRNNHIGLRPVWQERIEKRHEAAKWPQPPHSQALEELAMATVNMLLALQPRIDKIEAATVQCSERLPQTSIVASLPGAGATLTPAITAIVGMTAKEEDQYTALRCLCGVVPVDNKSGKRQHTKRRIRCNKHWLNTMHLFAHCSTNCSTWAKAYYKMHRASGDKHGTALRKLADKWLKILTRMIAENTPYDEEKYIQALKKSRSPVYEAICGKVGG